MSGPPSNSFLVSYKMFEYIVQEIKLAVKMGHFVANSNEVTISKSLNTNKIYKCMVICFQTVKQ